MFNALHLTCKAFWEHLVIIDSHYTLAHSWQDRLWGVRAEDDVKTVNTHHIRCLLCRDRGGVITIDCRRAYKAYAVYRRDRDAAYGIRHEHLLCDKVTMLKAVKVKMRVADAVDV